MLIKGVVLDIERSLHKVIKNRSDATVQLLLDISDANKNAEVDGRTPLVLALNERKVSLVQAHVASPNVDVNLANERGFTSIVIAGEKQCMDILLQSARVDLRCRDREGHTPLEWGAIKDHKVALTKFLRAAVRHNNAAL